MNVLKLVVVGKGTSSCEEILLSLRQEMARIVTNLSRSRMPGGTSSDLCARSNVGMLGLPLWKTTLLNFHGRMIMIVGLVGCKRCVAGNAA